MNHAFEDLKEHFSHYLVLFLILVLGVVSFVYFRRIPQAQIYSVFLTALFYTLWGIIHHYLEGDLHIRVVLEYFALSILGFLILWSVINRV
jgi:uncharacterized protein YqhQ